MTVSSCLSPVSDLLRFIPGRVCLSVCPCADRCTCVKRLLNASFLSLLLIPRTRWGKSVFLGKTANYIPTIPLLKMNLPPTVCTNLCLCVHTCIYEASWMCVLSLHESAVITQWRCPWSGSRHVWLRATSPHFIVSCAQQQNCCMCLSITADESAERVGGVSAHVCVNWE